MRLEKGRYIEYIKKALFSGRDRYEENIENWKGSFDPDDVFGYRTPGHIAVQAHMEGFLYSVTGLEEYAVWTKRCLLDIEQFKELYPPWKLKKHPEYEKGLPAVDGVFFLQPFTDGYLAVKDSGVLTGQEKRRIECSIKSCVYTMLHQPEWGAHNRSMLRAWSMALAAKALDKTEETEEWKRLAGYLVEETWGRWSIEDSTHYIPLWLIASVQYAEAVQKEKEYYSLPETKYYFDYMTHLITPYGQIPDFGDAHFNSNWYIWAVCLEYGAAAYKCGNMKYAAQKIVEYGLSLPGQSYSPGVANYFIYACRTADDGIIPVVPEWKSEEVMEELVGKKIAFRNGWKDNDTYLLLNYRDEGNYGYIPRQYLRTTLSVRAEKMHHGHGDENSVSILVKDRNILLNDGGYRENLPNGKYRSDIYHNRLVFRKGVMEEGKGIYEFLHDDGAYRHVTTGKIHFQDFKDVCVSRTRMHYEPLDLVWDRVVTYLKAEDTFAVVDWVYCNREQDMTIAGLWHTGEIIKQYGSLYETRINKIYRSPGDAFPIDNRKEYSLLIEFLQCDKMTGCEPVKRGYGQGFMIAQYSTGSYKKGDMECYVTILTPHRRTAVPGQLTGRWRLDTVSQENDAVALEYQGDNLIQLAYKLDLSKGLIEDEDEYPRYTWEKGKINYGDILTDADFAFVKETDEKLRYGFINGCGVEYKGYKHRTPLFTTYKFGTDMSAVSDHKWRAWDGEIKKDGANI